MTVIVTGDRYWWCEEFAEFIRAFMDTHSIPASHESPDLP